MKKYPTEFVDEVLPLPDNLDQSTLNEQGLFVVQGLDRLLASQLVERSKEPHVSRYCPGDSMRRFKDINAVEAWQRRGRLSLPLVRKMDNNSLKLEGFGWMGPGNPTLKIDDIQMPNLTVAFAERIYQDYVGRSLALTYAKAILNIHASLYGNKGVWLEAWADNQAATRTYRNVGFGVLSIVSSELDGEPMQRVLMTLNS